MANELVSIIMPAFNASKHIRKAISSVIIQTYKNWELIIVDDSSIDDTKEIVFSFQDERIIYFNNTINSGAATSRNIALRLAKGKWIAFLDSDDYWTGDKLEKQISFMIKNDINFSCTNYKIIDESGKETGILVTAPKIITKKKMKMACYVGCLTAMYNKDVIGEIQIDSRIKKRNDYAIWLKVVEKSNCYLFSENLAFYRKSSGSISSGRKYKLVVHHYRLFRFNNYGILKSAYFTVLNIIFTMVKKVLYQKRTNK